MSASTASRPPAGPRRKFSVAAIAAATLAIGLASSAPAAARGPDQGTVTKWIERLLAQVEAQATNPPRAARQLATLSVAIERALEGAVRARRLAPRAAITGAARRVLGSYYEDLARAPARGPGRRARSQRFGARLAQRVLDRHTGDAIGVLTTVAEAYPSAAEREYLWEPTPPGFQQNPLEPAAGEWRTWRIRDAAAYLPPPPPSADPEAPSHPRFLRQLREVYEVSQVLTPREETIAETWAGGPGTVTPPGYWNQIAINALAGSRPLFAATSRRDATGRSGGGRIGALAAARLFATLNSAQADAFIVAWLSKYTYWSPRPVTYIRRLIDPDWETYVATPPFPSYISGHSTVSGAAARVLARLLPIHKRRLLALGREATDSRLYGGIHYRADNLVGYRVGRRVGAAALARHR